VPRRIGDDRGVTERAAATGRPAVPDGRLSATPRAPLLQARALTKTYGSTPALDSVDLEIGEGVTGLLGSNGAGKSTLLKLALGLLRPDGGTLDVLGRPSTGPVEQRARIGYAPEHDCLPASVSSAELVAYMAELSGIPRKAARARTADMLRLIGLFEERHRPIGTYSTGMKQRVKVAQALVHDPTLALLDEPTGGLDPLGRRDMLELIGRISREFGISIVLSTHLMSDVERVCDAVVVLEAGQLLRSGRVSALTEETQSLVIDLVDGTESLARLLAERGFERSVTAGRIVLRRVGPDTYDAVRDAIVDSGATLYRLAPERATLTDLFSAPAGTAEGVAE
jgi:ABC-2 type transport system ATP-binding protein